MIVHDYEHLTSRETRPIQVIGSVCDKAVLGTNLLPPTSNEALGTRRHPRQVK